MKTIQNEFDPTTSAFSRLRPWWHLYTPGPSTPAMLLNDEDYRFAMNLLARCSVQFPNVKIVAFALMSNHIHLVISGKIELIVSSNFASADFRKIKTYNFQKS